MTYVQERCVLLIGDLSWLSQELRPAQQGTLRFSVFPEPRSALPQGSARIREMTVRRAGSCCRSLRSMCVAMSAPRKWREAAWPALGKIHSQEETQQRYVLGGRTVLRMEMHRLFEEAERLAKPNKTRAYLLSPDKKLECIVMGFSQHPSFLLPLLFGSPSPPTFRPLSIMGHQI